MGPLLDRFGQSVDKPSIRGTNRRRKQLGARVTFLVLLGRVMAFVRWRNR